MAVLSLPVDSLLVGLTRLSDDLLLVVSGLNVGQATLVLNLEIITCCAAHAIRQSTIESCLTVELLVHQINDKGPLYGLLVLVCIHDECLAVRQEHDALRSELTFVLDPLNLGLLLIGIELTRGGNVLLTALLLLCTTTLQATLTLRIARL